MRASRLWTGFSILIAVIFGAAGPRAIRAAQAAAPAAATEESRSQTILIFPCENKSKTPNTDWLGDGLSELTVDRLEDRRASVLSRRDRLAVLEKMGLPDSARFTHATLVKIAGEADADVVVYGQFTIDGSTVTLEARVLHISPPSLSPPLTETSSMQGVIRAHARLTWQILCAIDDANCPAEGANRDETSFSDPPASLHLEALQNLAQGLNSSDDDERLRLLREASRLEPTWDRPPFELGLIYFGRHDCDLALSWLSRVPPDRPNGPEASFDAGVCHLQRNDFARAVAAFSSLVDRSHSSDPKEHLPELPDARNNLGVSLMRQGKYADAEIEFERAAALDPGEPDYLVNLALTQIAQNEPAAGVAPLESAEKLSPDDEDERAILVALLKMLGRNSDADAVRAEMPGTAAATPLPNLKDSGHLMLLARVVTKFDRTQLWPSSDPAAAQPAPGAAPAAGGSKGKQP
ncbi:MAG: tetratricopeptide repeat protein [Candidatus Acidiferrales bacterium]